MRALPALLLLPVLPALLIGCDDKPAGPDDDATETTETAETTDDTTDDTVDETTDTGGPTSSDDTATATTEPGEPVPSTRADLRLKRWRQLSLDLEGALSLTSDQICMEAGVYDCVDLNVVPLGGVSVQNGVFEHPNTLQATSNLAIERLALQACYNRLILDLEGEPVIYTDVDLDAADASDAEAEAQITNLTRRLLARDPLPEETAALSGLRADVATEGGDNADWAVLVCFSLATSTEALTY